MHGSFRKPCLDSDHAGSLSFLATSAALPSRHDIRLFTVDLNQNGGPEAVSHGSESKPEINGF
jgi:hypothetical protein